MSGSATLDLERLLLGHTLAIAPMPTLSRVYVALCQTAPTETAGGIEASGGAYARAAATFALMSSPSNAASNAATVEFLPATSAWGTIGYFEIWTQPTGGTRLYWGQLTDPADGVPIEIDVTTGDTVRFSPGTLMVQAADMTAAGPFLPLTGGNLSGLLTCEDGLTVLGTVLLDRTAAVAISNALQNVYTGTLSVADPYANQIFQRDTRTGGLFGKGTGNILLTINPSQPVTVLEHRLRNAASPATVLQDWTSSAPPIAAGSQRVALTAPAGLYKYLVDLRANHDVVVSTTHAVMVGELIAFAGQSLAENMVSTAASGDPATIASFGLTPSPWSFVFASYASNSGAFPPVADGPDVNYPPVSWETPRDSGGVAFKSTFAVEFLNRLITLSGVPCAMLGYAVGGTSIDSWLPGYAGPNPGHWDKLVNILTLAGGRFAVLIWDQGHYESKNGNTAENYATQLQTLFSAVSAAFPGAVSNEILATIPGIGAYGSGPSAIVMVRNTAKAAVAGDATRVYVDGLDATLWSDLVHPSQAGNIPYARHFYRAVARLLGLSSRSDKGPVITGASRVFASKDIVLAATQTNGGTAWVSVGTPADQFTVYPAGTTASPVALDGAAPINLTNPAQITLQLAATPTEPFPLDVWYRRSPDTAAQVASGIYDNATDADGLTQGRQLWDNAAAIVVPQPTYPITVNTPAPATPNTTFTVTGTYSIGVPAALDYSWDSGITWTAATTPTIAGGNYSFSLTGGVPYGSFALLVRDHTITQAFGTSALFTVTYTPPALASNPGTLLLRLDASDPTTLWADTARTVRVVSGGTVAAWGDASGVGNHFEQTNAAQRPVYRTNIKNGLPGIRFTGSLTQFLRLVSGGTLPASLVASNYFVHVIFTPATLPSVAADVFQSGQGAAIGAANTVRFGQIRAAGTTYHTRTGTDYAQFVHVITAASAAANTLSKTIDRFDGTTTYQAVNAIAEGTAAIGVTPAPTSFDTAHLGIFFGTSTYQYPFDGWIHEIRIYGAFGTAGNKTDAQTYATSKWGS